MIIGNGGASEMWFGTIWKPVLLEIKIPKLIPKPIKAMEAVFVACTARFSTIRIGGKNMLSGEPQTSYKFEIASIDGKIHFYIRCLADYRDAVEAAVYSQFPEAEIEAVPDYTKQIPMDIPNKDWDLFGWDYYTDSKIRNFRFRPMNNMSSRALKRKRSLIRSRRLWRGWPN